MNLELQKKILEGAKKHIGYKEAKNNDNIFGKAFNLNNVAWCYLFVSYVLIHEAKIKITSCAYVPTGYNYYKANGKLFKEPQPSDLVFFDFDKDGIPEHIGICEKDNGDGTITTIEGNTSSGIAGSQANGDGVYRRKRHKSLILGYGRVI